MNCIGRLIVTSMVDIVTHCAVLGMAPPFAGILPVKVLSPAGDCLVEQSFPPRMTDERYGLDLDISDCTLFNVMHLDVKWATVLASAETADWLLEQALQAITEALLWSKASDRVQTVNAFVRQVGRLDVKVFIVAAENEQMVLWRNQLFWIDRHGAALINHLLGSAIIDNGPAATPLHPIVRRVLGVFDLLNLGFYAESFIAAFALLDDLSQLVVRAGLAQKQLTAKEQEKLLRAIKDDRLTNHLCLLTKLCGWESMDNAEPELFSALRKVNTLRNNIVHGSVRLDRGDAIESVDTVLACLDWLRTNPFGFVIPTPPRLQLANSAFVIVPPRAASENLPEAIPGKEVEAEPGSAPPTLDHRD